MCRIISFANAKGGTGKSVSCISIAACAAMDNQRVLLIDADPQGNTSFCCRADPAAGNTYDLISGRRKAKEIIQHTHTNNLDIIPASMNLIALTSSNGSATRLKMALETVLQCYDYIIIDNSPMNGELIFSSLTASTDIIMPMQADSWSIQGLFQTIGTAQQVARVNKSLEITGIIITRYDSRSTLTKELSKTIIEKANSIDVPILGYVPESVVVRESVAMQRNLFEYAPKSKPAVAYSEIYKKLKVTE